MIGYWLFGAGVLAIFLLSGALTRTIRSRDMWKREATVYLSALELDIPFSVKAALSDTDLDVSKGVYDKLYYIQGYNVRGSGRTMLTAIIDYTQHYEAVKNVRALRGEIS